jgi:hypothetical protein
MQHAAIAGADWAARRGAGTPAPATEVGPSADNALVESVVKDAAVGFVRTRITVHSEWPDGNDPGDTVKVTASYPLPLTVTRVFFPSGCGAPAVECRGAAVRTIATNH